MSSVAHHSLCPVCSFPPGQDHRRCYFQGLELGLWKTSSDWTAACEAYATRLKKPAVAAAAVAVSAAPAAAPKATEKKCSTCRQPGHTKRSCKGVAAGGAPATATPNTSPASEEAEPELTWEKVDTAECVEIPAGRYYLSDLCYALPDPIYDEIWGKQFNYNSGAYRRSDGAMFIVDHTAYGDGGYRGSDGNEYGVDAGVIALTSAALTDKPYGGTWQELKTPGTFSASDGVFELKGDGIYVRINTACDDEEDEDEEDGY